MSQDDGFKKRQPLVHITALECSQEDVSCRIVFYWLTHRRICCTYRIKLLHGLATLPTLLVIDIPICLMRRAKKRGRTKTSLYIPFSRCKSIQKFDRGQLHFSFFSSLLSLLVLIWRWQICASVSLAVWDYEKLFIITPLV